MFWKMCDVFYHDNISIVFKIPIDFAVRMCFVFISCFVLCNDIISDILLTES